MRPVPSSWTTTICVRGLYILRCCEKSAGAVVSAGKFGRKNWPSAVAGRRVRSFAAGAMGANQSNQIDPKGQRENGSTGRYVQPKIRTKTLPCARRAFTKTHAASACFSRFAVHHKNQAKDELASPLCSLAVGSPDRARRPPTSEHSLVGGASSSREIKSSCWMWTASTASRR